MKLVREQKGFTLIEMLIVMAIFVVMSGTFLFSFGEFQDRTRLENYSYAVALAVRRAQSIGITSSFSPTEDLVIATEIGNVRPVGAYFVYDQVEDVYESDITIYQDLNRNGVFDSGDTNLGGGELPPGVRITAICEVQLVTRCRRSDSVGEDVSVNFRRPSPDPMIHIGDGGVLSEDTLAIRIEDKIGDAAFVMVEQSGFIHVAPVVESGSL